MGYRIYTHDAIQAYTQSEDPRAREIYLRPKQNDLDYFCIQENEVLELVRPSYGTTDAGDNWNATIANHIQQDLRMKPMREDASTYAKFSHNEKAAIGTLVMLVDDGLLAGSDAFQRLTEKTPESFESRPRESGNVEFFGMSIHNGKKNSSR